MDGNATVAAMLDQGLAGWIDDQLAGGVPPKWVAQMAADAARDIAVMLRGTGPLPEWLAEIMDLRGAVLRPSRVAFSQRRGGPVYTGSEGSAPGTEGSALGSTEGSADGAGSSHVTTSGSSTPPAVKWTTPRVKRSAGETETVTVMLPLAGIVPP